MTRPYGAYVACTLLVPLERVRCYGANVRDFDSDSTLVLVEAHGEALARGWTADLRFIPILTLRRTNALVMSSFPTVLSHILATLRKVVIE